MAATLRWNRVCEFDVSSAYSHDTRAPVDPKPVHAQKGGRSKKGVADAKIVQLTQELSERDKTLSIAKQQLSESQLRVLVCNAKIAKLEHDLSERNVEQTATNKKLIATGVRLSMETEKRKRCDTELAISAEELSGAKAQVAKLTQELSERAFELSERTGELSEKANELLAANKTILEVGVDLVATVQELSVAKQKLLEAKQKLLEANVELTKNKEELLGVRKELADMEAKLSDSNAKLLANTEQAGMKRKHVAHMQQLRDTLQQYIDVEMSKDDVYIHEDEPRTVKRRRITFPAEAPAVAPTQLHNMAQAQLLDEVLDKEHSQKESTSSREESVSSVPENAMPVPPMDPILLRNVANVLAQCCEHDRKRYISLKDLRALLPSCHSEMHFKELGRQLTRHYKIIKAGVMYNGYMHRFLALKGYELKQ